MPWFPPGWTLDGLSFALGFASATLLAGLLFALRRPSAARDRTSQRTRENGERGAVGDDSLYRANVLRLAERAHVAAPLFPLPQVLVEPSFLAPPPHVDPLNPVEPEMFTSVPHWPDWPGLPAAFKIPGLSLADLWTSGGHLLIAGEPGTGKTVALAAIAMRTAAGHPDVGGRRAPTPVFIHAADLPLPADDDPARALISAAQPGASPLMTPRLPKYLRTALKNGEALLLLDGLDELAASAMSHVVTWLGKLMTAFPRLRIIAAGPANGYGSLLRLGLLPVTLQDWSADAQAELVQRWAQAWSAATLAGSDANAESAEVDPAILAGWLATGNAGRTPLDLTLRLWAGFAGDPLGLRPADGFEAFVRRHARDAGSRAALEAVALAQCRSDGRGMMRRDVLETGRAEQAGVGGKPAVEFSDSLTSWTDEGLFVQCGDDRLDFAHPLIAAYLAASHLAASPACLADGRTGALWPAVLQFAAGLGDIGQIVSERLSNDDDVLLRQLLDAARLVRDAPSSAPCRAEVLRRLAAVLLNPEATDALRSRALAALLAMREPSAAQLFRASLSSSEAGTRRLAAWGLGAMRDAGAVPRLAGLLNDESQSVRWAASLALVAIGNTAAVEALATVMLQGEETARRSAAEALSRHPQEGHPILKEALGEDDILLRRAAIFGLAKVGQPWATEALKQVEMNDPQWVVRSAATEALKSPQAPGERLPRPLPAPENLPWLLAWAAKRGMGVPPGPPAISVLLKATQDGTPEERMAAVETLGHVAGASVARELYLAMRDTDPRVRDLAIAALHRIALGGERLPPPGTDGL